MPQKILSTNRQSHDIDNKTKLTRQLMLFSLIGLVLILPVAHTTTIRAFFLIVALLFWLLKSYLLKEFHFRKTPLDIFILIYLLTIIASLFTSLKLSSSLYTFKTEFLTNTVLFYLIVSNIDKEGAVKKIVAALFAGSAIMAIYGIPEFFLKGGSLFNINYRADSFHQGYEAYGQYLIIVLPFNVMGIVYSRGIHKKGLLIILFLANVFALYLTHTRGAWLAFWIEMMLLSSFALPGKLRAIALSVLILIPLAGAYSLPSNVIWHGEKGLEKNELDYEHNTGSIRLTMWEEAIKSLKEEPFKGAGYGKANFRRKFADKDFAKYEQSHNTFVNTAIQLGVQGLIALLLIIFAILKTTWKGWKSEKQTFKGYYYLGTFAMTIGFFIACQFAEFFIDDTAQMFWIFAGLAVAVYIRKEKVDPSKILFIRRDNIGDLICTTPAIHAVREKFPNAKIGVLVNSYNADAIVNNPDLDEVYIYEKAKHVPEKNKLTVWWNNFKVLNKIRREKYDVAIGCGSYSPRLARYTFLTGAKTRIGYFKKSMGKSRFYNMPLYEAEGSAHEVEKVFDLLAPLGINGRPPALTIVPADAELIKIRNFLNASGIGKERPLIAFHISSRRPENRWPADKFIELGNFISGEADVLLLWSPGSEKNPYHPGDDEKAEAIMHLMKTRPSAYKTTKLRELISALNLSDIIVCCDGGAMHIAAALGKPVVAIWGSTNPDRWRPWGIEYILLKDEHKKAEMISAEATFSAVEKLLRYWRLHN